MSDLMFSGLAPQARDAAALPQIRSAILAADWSDCGLGAVGAWPALVQGAVRLVLASAQPRALLIGAKGAVICNAAARDLFGDGWGAAQGCGILDLLPDARAALAPALAAALQGNGQILTDLPLQVSHGGQDQTRWFTCDLTPVPDEAGKVLAVMLSASETTAHVTAEAALKCDHARLFQTVEAGGVVGTWSFDLETRTTLLRGLLVDRHGAQIRAGLKPEFAPDVPPPGGVMVLDFKSMDRRIRCGIAREIERALKGDSTYNHAFSMTGPDGLLRKFVATGRPVHDQNGAVHQLVGIVIDITKQADVSSQLAASNLRFETLVEAVPQIVWSAEPNGQLIFFNQRWHEFTGVAQAFITLVMWRKLIHPDDWRRVAETWSHSLATGERYEIDYRFRHKSGQFRWLHVVGLPILGVEGEVVRWYGTATDVQDAKMLDQERQLVNRELDHRIGNLFSLLNGLVNMSVRDQPDSAPFGQDLRNRLAALHRAHKMALKTHTIAPVPLQSLLEAILMPYQRKDGPAFTLSGPAVLLKQDMVSSFALVFHELATNAAKYGAFAGAEGRVSLELSCDGITTQIRWREEGGMDPDNGRSQIGFGSKLLTTVIEGQFHGHFKREWTPGGLVVTLSLPSSLFALDAQRHAPQGQAAVSAN